MIYVFWDRNIVFQTISIVVKSLKLMVLTLKNVVWVGFRSYWGIKKDNVGV